MGESSIQRSAFSAGAISVVPCSNAQSETPVALFSAIRQSNSPTTTPPTLTPTALPPMEHTITIEAILRIDGYVNLSLTERANFTSAVESLVHVAIFALIE